MFRFFSTFEIWRLVYVGLWVVAPCAVVSCETQTLVVGRYGPGGAGAGNQGTGGDDGQGGDGGSECVALAQSCTSADSCCSAHCSEGVCLPNPVTCTPDGQTCQSGESCCSGHCDEGTCAALSGECLTWGNVCEEDQQCCSALCEEGRCQAGSSYCRQESDACLEDADCCSLTCSFLEGGAIGTCAEVPTGAANCRGVAGSVCDSCNDCCSRVCAPHGESGKTICVQPSGCRQTGEVCVEDFECCGGDEDADLPGAGNVYCDKQDGASVGICRNAMGCSPQGNACHFQDYVCSVSAASNRCCDFDGNDGECVLDALGVPRCSALGEVCRDNGADCARDDDCCEGRCLPGDDDRLRCSGSGECRVETESCTTSSSCCVGLVCRRLQDQAFGACAVSENLSCALVGQPCSTETSCCSGSSCVDGSCEVGEVP